MRITDRPAVGAEISDVVEALGDDCPHRVTDSRLIAVAATGSIMALHIGECVVAQRGHLAGFVCDQHVEKTRVPSSAGEESARLLQGRSAS